ncbi:hypothetical protein AB0M32_18620 [Streptomyces sp. NPDC051985]|uniref:hypothetical protein n=1 Tax=Streptomyces sp. NPDC051985 TaxID=3155807 RepID=UPI00341CFA44
MERNDTAHTTDTRLSTEDLVRSRETGTAPGGTSSPPVYPGESGTRADANDVGADEAGPRTPAARAGDPDELPRLLTPEDEEDFRARWEKIQTAFVDDPRDTVQAADSLVAHVMRTLAATFDQHRKELEEQWSRGGDADTEALRTALRHYRSFFNRLLTS